MRYISHELRTPLNTAFLGLKLLTGEMKASKDTRDIERYDTLCDVNISCMAAVDILNDLLCYDKLDSGILELHKENVNVVPFLNDSVSMFFAQAREGGVTINVETGDCTEVSTENTPNSLQLHDSIFVDKFKMDQVIRNIISNALKFTPRGGSIIISAKFKSSVDSLDELSVDKVFASRSIWPNSLTHIGGCCCCKGCRVSNVALPRHFNVINPDTGPVDGHLVLVVTDSGAGISIENQKRLFKDIVQFSPEKLQAGGGSGLGLWISSGIVDLHGGKITVNSGGEGLGSSFTVEIPMHRLPSCENLHEEQDQESDQEGEQEREHEREQEREHQVKQEREQDGEQRQEDISDTVDAIQTFSELNTIDGNEEIKINKLSLSQLSLDSTLPPRAASFFCPSLKPGNMGYDVLVVDDSRLNRKMLLKFLLKNENVCTEAEDGLEAIEVVKERIDFSESATQ